MGISDNQDGIHVWVFTHGIRGGKKGITRCANAVEAQVYEMTLVDPLDQELVLRRRTND